MNFKKKLFAFLASGFCMSVLLSVVTYAKEDKDLDGKALTAMERLEYALQGMVTGLLTVFAVLALLWGIVSLMKVFFYDIPQKKKKKQEMLAQAVEASIDDNTDAVPDQVTEQTLGQASDDGELLAVITAAVAAMINSGEYADEFAGGFRVVSFKRNTSSGKSWNKK